MVVHIDTERRSTRIYTKQGILVNYLIYFILTPILIYTVGVKDKNVWMDYPTYIKYFEMSTTNTVVDIILTGKDPFFQLLNKPFTWMNDGFEYFLFTIASVTLLIKIRALQNSTNNFLILLILYSSFLLCLHDYIQIRVSLAIAICAWAIYVSKSTKRSLVLFLIAALIHLSVSLVIIFYLVYLYCSKRVLIVTIIASFFLPFIVFSGIIPNARIATYVSLAASKEQYYQINIFATQPILQAMSIIVIFFSKQLKKYKWTFEFCISLAGVFIFYSFYKVPVFAFRLFELTMFFNIILLSKSFNLSVFIKGICFLYILVGFKNMFYGASALL
ncbi:TPA: EpsG family protein [Klebsiella pneumoniae]|nr:EpsG family protein [Klebsiella pneumoniae]HBV3671352.1 EpsG family protein [Klebsiella pneumoniae]